MSDTEIRDNRTKTVRMDRERCSVIICKPGQEAAGGSKEFTYDSVYDETSEQQQIYEETAFSIVESVMEGYNGTIFAYGQTGTGNQIIQMPEC